LAKTKLQSTKVPAKLDPQGGEKAYPLAGGARIINRDSSVRASISQIREDRLGASSEDFITD